MKQVDVVVMGRNYASLLGMIRSVGEAGYGVHVIRTITRDGIMMKTPDEVSKYVNKYTYAYEPERDNLIKVIREEFIDVNKTVILMPTDDFTTSTIDQYADELREHFLFPYVDRKKGTVNGFMDKALQKKMAKEAGILTTDSWEVNIKDGNYLIPDDIEYPCFTKPQISFMGNKRCMKRCNNSDELKAVLDEIIESGRKDCPILVEQYLPVDVEYAVQGCCLDQKVIIPGVIRKMATGKGSHCGVAAVGRVIDTSEIGELENKIVDFLKELNYIGTFDIDLIKSEEGLIYFNELNLRTGANGYSITHTGVNLPDMLIKYLVNKKIENPERKCESDKVFLSDKVAFERYWDGYVDWKTYKKERSESDFSLIDQKSDNRPYKTFKLMTYKIRIKKIVKKIIGRK